MRPSVLLSTADVASSRTRTFDFRNNALPRQTSCRSPTLKHNNLFMNAKAVLTKTSIFQTRKNFVTKWLKI
jgi:hypothetical protein